MIIDRINLNHIRIFESVYRNNSMTKSAFELHMTQSGVSQHIKILEEVLGLKLFDRIRQRLVPTVFAKELYDVSTKALSSIEKTLLKLSSHKKTISGLIKVGFSLSISDNKIISQMTNFSKLNPKIQFEFLYVDPSKISDLVGRGDVDIALMNDGEDNKDFIKIKLYEENLHLCISDNDLLKQRKELVEDKKYCEKLEFIENINDLFSLKKWFQHHFDYLPEKLKIKASIMNIQGLARLINENFGAGILPDHLILSLQQQGMKFKLINPQYNIKNYKPLINNVYISYSKEKTLNYSCLNLISYLKESLG
jgi:DNA-binding transcriptional LysR family regulator